MFISKLHNIQSKFSGNEGGSYENPLHQKDGERVTEVTIFRTGPQQVQDALGLARKRQPETSLPSIVENEPTSDEKNLRLLTKKEIINICILNGFAEDKLGYGQNKINLNKINREDLILTIMSKALESNKSINFYSHLDKFNKLNS
jgi:hypothetical protein